MKSNVAEAVPNILGVVGTTERSNEEPGLEAKTGVGMAMMEECVAVVAKVGVYPTPLFTNPLDWTPETVKDVGAAMAFVVPSFLETAETPDKGVDTAKAPFVGTSGFKHPSDA